MTETASDNGRPAKAPYDCPKIIDYGNVTELTQKLQSRGDAMPGSKTHSPSD